MTSERKEPEEFDDARMAWLLSSACETPPLRDEFVNELSQRLDEQFERTGTPFGAVLHGQPSANGAASRINAAPHRATEGASASLPRWRRAAVALATAATLLAAIALWSSRPAYGWASMIRALQECKWIEATSAGGADGDRGWISAIYHIVAVKDNEHIVIDNHDERLSSVLWGFDSTIYQTQQDRDHSWNWESELLRLVLDLADNAQVGPDDQLRVELVDESWRRVQRDGGPEVIELRVKLRVEGKDSRSVQLVLHLDPDTQLPIDCRVLNDDGTEVRDLEFTYPQEGPRSIYALGVSEEYPVMEAAATSIQMIQPNQAQRAVAPAETVVIVAENQSADAPQTSADVRTPHKAHSQDEAPPWSPPAEPLPIEELSQRVGEELAQLWQSQGIRPVDPATDAEFMRRVYLDLTGRIPTVNEVHQFLDDDSPDRRERLVDELLAHRDHATHLAAVWRGILIPEGVDLSRFGGTTQFDRWLADRFEDNVPYDQLVRELLLAEGRVSESGPLLFYAALKLNPEELAAKTSRAFLGVRMDCAQCHDHPFTDVSQEDFWSLAAFFARISRPQGKMEMTSPVLRVHDTQYGDVTIPETDETVPPRIPLAAHAVEETEDSPSRRRQLVDWLTARDNRQFAQAAVNRVWAHLFGRGLVEPVDDMRPDNDPIAPEVLETLSGDFAASGFDLRRLFRALVLTDAYQLSSRAEKDDPSRPLHFAQMNIKSFTAEQLYDCISVATRRGASLGDNGNAAALARFQDTNRQAFIQQFRASSGDTTDYQAGIPQALTLMHGGLITSATDLATGGLLKSLAAPFFNDEQRVDSLFLATLSRYPDPDERDRMLGHVQAASSNVERQQVLGDVLWALLNSAEFTFNH